MSDITLYEAMQYIDEYLTEKAPRGAFKKYMKIQNDKLDTINKAKDSYEELSKTNPHAKRNVDEMRKAEIKIKRNALANTGNGSFEDLLKKKKTDIDKKYDELNKGYGKVSNSAKTYLGQGINNMKSKLEKKPAGLYARKELSNANQLVYKK